MYVLWNDNWYTTPPPYTYGILISIDRKVGVHICREQRIPQIVYAFNVNRVLHYNMKNGARDLTVEPHVVNI